MLPMKLKQVIAVSILTLTSTAFAATQPINTPESVYFDPQSNLTFVSNIGGQPADKDGNGFISVLPVTFRTAETAEVFVRGLNAPKGLRARNGILWAADIDEVVKIDIKSRRILKKISVPGANFLNDVALSPDGRVFVSDTINSQIFVLTKDVPTLFAAGRDLGSPNGLIVSAGKLYVASWGFITDPATFGTTDLGHIYAIDLKTKKRTPVTVSGLGHLDGLEITSSGDFIASDYAAGKVFRVSPNGDITTVHKDLKNSADIGLRDNLILVPEMGANRVVSLSL